MGRVYIPERANKTSPDQYGTWSDSVKTKAAMLYVQTGSIYAVQKELNVPSSTLSGWLKTEWWDTLVRQLHNEKDTEINQKVTGLIDKALLAIEDRIDKGDLQYDPRTGELVRVPVKAQVLTRLQTDLAKQRKDYTTKPTEKQIEDKHQLENKLKTLADTFTSFVKKKNVEEITEKRVTNSYEVLTDGTIIDEYGVPVDPSLIKEDDFNFKKREDTDAIYDQREEGLHQGTQLGKEKEAIPVKGQSTEEQG